MPHLPWPVPALLAWATCWITYYAMGRVGVPVTLALVLAALVGVALSLTGRSWWRQAIIAAGFPVSVAITGAAVVPAGGWLVLLVFLAWVYPLNAWRDAPLFPTPAGALLSLGQSVFVPEGALVLDAGCGLGHGLAALQQAYPKARLHGIEWSWPLWALCALRCRGARVSRGDIWRADWRQYALVYMFQRPESMSRAVIKAASEMQPDSWLVSLEFEATELVADAQVTVPDGRPLWVYRVPFSRRSE